MWVMAAGVCAMAADENDASQPNLELLARWSLNHGSYLLDVGKYLEALEAFDTSFESSSQTSTKVDALLHRAMTLATFLDAPDAALQIYRRIEQEFPDHAETGQYREGLLLFDVGRHGDAVKVLEAYLRKYPQGKFRFQSEALIDQARSLVEPAPKPAEKPQAVVRKPETGPEPGPDRPKPPEEAKKITGPSESPKVRVLLFRKASGVRLNAKQLQVFDGGERVWKGSTLDLNVKGGRVMLAGGTAVGSQLKASAQGPIEVRVGKNKKTVRGELNIALHDDRLRVTNTIDIESYLRGVVPSESYASWPLETLRAQAVAARTYVLYQVRHRTRRAYDVVDNEGDQAYSGVAREHPRTDQAVSSTAGQILVDPARGAASKPILAMYSANSGGHTADAKAIFRVDNSILKARPDPWSLEGKMATWKRKYTRTEVEKGLARVGVKVRNLRAIEPLIVGPSGRLIKVRLLHSGKAITVRSRPVLTGALKLPEILVDIRKEGDVFVFNGRGWGHGVGYSQWGGAGMGKDGKDYRQILAFYYAGSQVRRLW
jgi:stage II sporulation protein D